MQNINCFVRDILPIIDVTINEILHGTGVLEIRLPENLRGKFPEFGQRTVVRITMDRQLDYRLREVVLLDFETPFLQYLIQTAKSESFGGLYACLASESGNSGILAAFKLRWQNDQGDNLTEEFIPLFAFSGGGIQTNPPFLARWLVSPVQSMAVPDTNRTERREIFDRLIAEANRKLGAESTRFKHPNGLIQLAASDAESLT